MKKIFLILAAGFLGLLNASGESPSEEVLDMPPVLVPHNRIKHPQYLNPERLNDEMENLVDLFKKLEAKINDKNKSVEQQKQSYMTSLDEVD